MYAYKTWSKEDETNSYDYGFKKIMENIQKKVYEKPEFQVVELEMETPLLAASPEQPTNSHSPAFYRGHGFN